MLRCWLLPLLVVFRWAHTPPSPGVGSPGSLSRIGPLLLVGIGGTGGLIDVKLEAVNGVLKVDDVANSSGGTMDLDFATGVGLFTDGPAFETPTPAEVSDRSHPSAAASNAALRLPRLVAALRLGVHPGVLLQNL